MKRKVILDCDPGHDDAIAILLAGNSPEIELLGITIESGNQTLDKTGRNALNLCSYLNIDVPVSLGRDKPLKREPITCGEIHGETGLDGFDFPKHEKRFDERSADELLADLVSKNEHVTLVGTGALTNIGYFLINHKDLCAHIDEIVLMGGSIGFGNVTPAAEFNILCDPEAAEIVFNSGIKVKMIGLDVTRKVLVLPNVLERMKLIDNKASNLFYKLMLFFNKTQKEVFGLDGGPLHDPATIVSLLNNEVITFKSMNVEIDTSGGCSYGRTNCDQFDYLKKPHNALVAIDINVNKYWDEIEKGLKRYN